MLNIEVAEPQRYDSLTIFPLLTRSSVELPYGLLSEALCAGTVNVTEIGSGTVSAVCAANHGDVDVLILDGEQLIGACQNRMTNRSLVLRARSELRIPVSCVEQGRWESTSGTFQPTRHHSPAMVRRRAREAEAEQIEAVVPASLEIVLSRAQGAIWLSIAERSFRVGRCCATDALNQLYELWATEVEAWVRWFPLRRRQVGVLVFAGECPLGIDIVGGEGLYARLHERLVKGYALDALEKSNSEPATPARAQQFLHVVQTARRVEASTVGGGSYSVLTGGVMGGELRRSEQLLHISAFPA